MAKKTHKETAQKQAGTEGVNQNSKKQPKRTSSPKKLLEEAKEAAQTKKNKSSGNPKRRTNARKSAKRKKITPSVLEISPEETARIEEEKARILSRRNLVFELKKAGASYRQISEHLKNKGIEGASVGQVHADYQFMLEDARENLALSVEQYVEEEIAILWDVHFAFCQDMKHESNRSTVERSDAAKIVIAAHNARCKLRNLYKPVKIQLDADDELAKLLNISKEELPEVEQSPDS